MTYQMPHLTISVQPIDNVVHTEVESFIMGCRASDASGARLIHDWLRSKLTKQQYNKLQLEFLNSPCRE